MDTNPCHCEAFHGNGIDMIAVDTNGMDTNGFVAGEPAAVANAVAVGTGHASSAPEPAQSPGEGRKRAPKRWLAHARSLRDNYHYRASFTHSSRPFLENPMTTFADHEIVLLQPASLPALRAADAGVAESLESVISGNTRRVYGTQWRLFDRWCAEVGLLSLPGRAPHRGPLPAHRANSAPPSPPCVWPPPPSRKPTSGRSWNRPGKDPGVRASLKGWGRRLSKPQRQSGALTADVLAVIRLTAVQPRARGRGIETPEQAAQRAKFDLALVAILSDAGPAAFGGGGAHLGQYCALGRRAPAAFPSPVRRPTSRLPAPWWPSPPSP